MSIKPATRHETAALGLAERNGWPPELCALIERYPREVWIGHENLGQMAQFWLSRHNMFRELAASITECTAQFQAGELEADKGFVVPKKGATLGYFRQSHEVKAHGTVMDVLLSGFGDLVALRHALAEAQVAAASGSEAALSRLSDLDDQYHRAGADAIERRVTLHVKQAASKCPPLQRKAVTTHSLRHSCAMRRTWR